MCGQEELGSEPGISGGPHYETLFTPHTAGPAPGEVAEAQAEADPQKQGRDRRNTLTCGGQGEAFAPSSVAPSTMAISTHLLFKCG